MLLEEGLEGRGVGTDELVNLLAILEEGKGGHGLDAELLGELGKLVNVELGEGNLVLEGRVVGPAVTRRS